MTNLRDVIQTHYAKYPHRIAPFIGGAFEQPDEAQLRLMTIGINSYISPKDWDVAKGHPHPAWFSGWFRNLRHRFDKGVRRESQHVAQALAARVARFAGKRLVFPESWFHTNAIPYFMTEAEGTRAAQIGSDVFTRHVRDALAQLTMMAERGALPHVIAIFGTPFWQPLCAELHADARSRTPRLARAIQPAAGASRHYANRLVLRAGDDEHEVLLVRLRHPAARTNIGSARWLLAQPDFCALAGLA